MEIFRIHVQKFVRRQFVRADVIIQERECCDFSFQTHPNIDKKLFSQNSVIALKQGGKGFPMNSEIGILKWRLQTKDENMIPLTSESVLLLSVSVWSLCLSLGSIAFKYWFPGKNLSTNEFRTIDINQLSLIAVFSVIAVFLILYYHF